MGETQSLATELVSFQIIPANTGLWKFALEFLINLKQKPEAKPILVMVTFFSTEKG